MFAISDDKMVGYDHGFNPNKFLIQIGSCLKDYKPGGFEVGNLINSYCSQFNLNQRILLVTLQREGGRLLSTKDLEVAKMAKNDAGYPVLDWCCCVGLPDDWSQIKKSYEGFNNQLRGACQTYKFWYSNFKPNLKKEMIGEPPIICDNAATYSLAMYTPHSESLRLTAELYNRYFGDKK